MPPRQSVLKRQPQAQPRPHLKKPGEEQLFNVPLIAEKLLAWASQTQHWRTTTEGQTVIQHRYKPEGAAELSPREWLRTLTPTQFDAALKQMAVHCISFSANETWFHSDASVTPLPSDEAERALAKALGTLKPDRIDAALPAIEKQLQDWYAKTRRVIKQRGTQKHDQQMREQDKKVLIHDGVPYRPLPLAAQMAQAPRQTILNWIKNKTEFAGRPLDSLYLAPLDRYLVSEDSIQRMKTRFVKWPSNEPAGAVTIGKTKDRSGFIGMLEAATIAGVSKRTMWLWVSQEKAPTDKPLDVVKCTTSDRFYIREKDAYALKKLVPKSGLQRGRRPQLAL